MELHNMKPTTGSKSSKKRIGRGDKTAGRGENGQKSRAGFSNKIGFEGGQNPLYRRLPKRGFKNINSITHTIVNIESLEKLKLSEITPEILVENGVIKPNYKTLKILGKGTLSTAMKVSAHKFSKTAKASIEKAGGSIVLLELEQTKTAE